MFMQLQGIVFIQLQENYIIVNKEIYSLKEIYLFEETILIQQRWVPDIAEIFSQQVSPATI